MLVIFLIILVYNPDSEIIIALVNNLSLNMKVEHCYHLGYYKNKRQCMCICSELFMKLVR